jgi:hypothetical protein
MYRLPGQWPLNVPEEFHKYLAETIRARSGNGRKAGADDFDLKDEAPADSFDLLVEDAALPDDSDLIPVSPTDKSSDLDLAALDQDSDLALAEETHVAPAPVPQKTKERENQVVFEGDVQTDESHEVDFEEEEEESVLESGGSSPQLGLAGDSGFDVLVAANDEGNVNVGNVPKFEEDTETASLASSEFTLEPTLSAIGGEEDSESSSQVIAVDVGLIAATQEADPVGQTDVFNASDFIGIDRGVSAPAAAAANDPFGAAATEVFATPVAAVSPKKAATAQEAEYSTGALLALFVALVPVLISAMMLIDTMVHMWSWGEPYTLNSLWMGEVSRLLGL